MCKELAKDTIIMEKKEVKPYMKGTEYEWSAYYKDSKGLPHGYGDTEQEAIDDLIFLHRRPRA